MKKIKDFIFKFKTKMTLSSELLAYFWKNRLWWMIPMVFVLVIFGLFLFLAQGTAILHFVYPLF